MDTNKRCAKCKQVKPTGLFYTNRRQAGGFDCYCKVCRSEYSRANNHKYISKRKGPTIETYYVCGVGDHTGAMLMKDACRVLGISTTAMRRILDNEYGLVHIPHLKPERTKITKDTIKALSSDIENGILKIPQSDTFIASASRAITSTAIRNGVLVRPDTCQICDTRKTDKGSKNVSLIVAHHWNGYDSPLDVWWLCRSCNNTLTDKHDGSLTLQEARVTIHKIKPVQHIRQWRWSSVTYLGGSTPPIYRNPDPRVEMTRV